MHAYASVAVNGRFIRKVTEAANKTEQKENKIT